VKLLLLLLLLVVLRPMHVCVYETHQKKKTSIYVGERERERSRRRSKLRKGSLRVYVRRGMYLL
jgi:hypothetical protein